MPSYRVGFELTVPLAAGALPPSSRYEDCGEYTQCSYPTQVYMYSCIHADTTDVDMPTQRSYIILIDDADTQYTHTYMCIYIVCTHTQDTLLPPSLLFPSLPPFLPCICTCVVYVTWNTFQKVSMTPQVPWYIITLCVSYRGSTMIDFFSENCGSVFKYYRIGKSLIPLYRILLYPVINQIYRFCVLTNLKLVSRDCLVSPLLAYMYVMYMCMPCIQYTCCTCRCM